MRAVFRHSIYWCTMVQRLLALALALGVIGAPLAANVCAVVCGAHSGQLEPTAPASHHHESLAASHHHHSDAAAAPTTRGVRLVATAHTCGHLEAFVSEPRELTRTLIDMVIV